MKWNIQRVIAFLLLIALSIGFGFAYDGVAIAVERHKYPQEASVADLIKENANAFGVPEPILWATVRVQSNFSSNAVSPEGAIGLMQITPETLAYVYTHILKTEIPDSGMLYDPATNMRCGAAWISALYQRYGVWETVYAAYYAGTDAVDAWLASPETVTPQGMLQSIPDNDTSNYIKKVVKAVQMYSNLYYQS